MLTIQPYETAQQSLCAFDIDPDSPPPSIAADIEIAIVDDRPLMCDCLARGLTVFEPAFRFQHFSSIEAFDAASLDETQRISTVLMCVMWSNSEADHHLARIAHLKATRPSVNAIILADIENLDDILKAIEKGARGYVPTSVSLQVAAKAIHLVAAGGFSSHRVSFTNRRKTPRTASKRANSSRKTTTFSRHARSRSSKPCVEGKRTRSSPMNSTCARARSRCMSAIS
ncbi:hypothetical protein [Mesorhizobium sp. M7D.F.Ca.US.005.01.1.1]|uniref:hypothetical protein n=1 Tax=Mesorhizobium sp. M7D.F.Ca.US.005.01.1.1 TaxID=2493678 RepID=UPI001FE0BA01|nr:hypothetical protein [Mesorhizobium sp. M7D.F.Ca.US.005.01.1.1]